MVIVDFRCITKSSSPLPHCEFLLLKGNHFQLLALSLSIYLFISKKQAYIGNSGVNFSHYLSSFCFEDLLFHIMIITPMTTHTYTCTHTSPSTNIVTSQFLVKLIFRICPFHGILLSNQKEWTIDIQPLVWVSSALCWVKKRSHTVWFHLYIYLEITKLYKC